MDGPAARELTLAAGSGVFMYLLLKPPREEIMGDTDRRLFDDWLRLFDRQLAELARVTGVLVLLFRLGGFGGGLFWLSGDSTKSGSFYLGLKRDLVGLDFILNWFYVGIDEIADAVEAVDVVDSVVDEDEIVFLNDIDYHLFAVLAPVCRFGSF